MEKIGDRIKKIRKELPGKVTQAKFGEALGVSYAVIASYELNKVIPPPATLKLLCVTYGVNQAWLETGEGEPYIPGENASLAQEVRDIFRGQSEFRVSVMTALAAMPDDWWAMWEEQLRKEIDATKKDR